MKIGFIGIGIMGAPMAGRLLDGGHELFVNDINPIPQALLDKGATVAVSAREAAEMGEVVIVMVPDTPNVEVVLFGENSVADGLSDSKIVVDMSSISPVETKEFAEKINALGCSYLDAPVSGGEVGAKDGTLTIMVGGDQATFDKVKPLFELMGRNITLVGKNGDGQTCKVANQIIVALTIEAVGEALLFASKAGADPAKVRKALMGGFGRADDQADVRPRFPHHPSPKGSEPGLVQRTQASNGPAQHRHRPGTLQQRGRPGRQRVGPLCHGPGP
jgi:2-hydroxy-3-oxopropionate reductase